MKNKFQFWPSSVKLWIKQHLFYISIHKSLFVLSYYVFYLGEEIWAIFHRITRVSQKHLDSAFGTRHLIFVWNYVDYLGKTQKCSNQCSETKMWVKQNWKRVVFLTHYTYDSYNINGSSYNSATKGWTKKNLPKFFLQ